VHAHARAEVQPEGLPHRRARKRRGTAHRSGAARRRLDCVGIDDGIVLSSAVNAMQINADFDKRVVQPPPRPEDWLPSPMTGVHRYLLDRVGGEIARRRASALRRGFALRASRARCGEESSCWRACSRTNGRPSAGTYLRNRRIRTRAVLARGCTLFVKLWQFVRGDLRTVRTDTRSADWHPGWFQG